MFVRTSTRSLFRCLLLLVALSVVAGQFAAAQPPPPSFVDFLISNQTGFTATGIKVELWESQSNYTTLPSQATTTVTIDQLGNGRNFTFEMGNTFGIAKIRVTAFCPAPKKAIVEITADQGQFAGPPPAPAVFAGFCKTAPPGQSNFQPRVTFSGGGTPSATLQAKDRWGTVHWGTAPNHTPKVSTAPFN